MVSINPIALSEHTILIEINDSISQAEHANGGKEEYGERLNSASLSSVYGNHA
jgi:hypothetical protein